MKTQRTSFKIGAISLGCPRNTVDTEKMLGKIFEEGGELTPPEKAEYVLINTCAFLREARVESENTIRKFLKKGKKVIVTGCLPVYYKEKITEKFPEIIGSLGPGDLSKIDLFLKNKDKHFYWNSEKEETILPRFLSTYPSWAYLKIGDGCDNLCSYCLIPKLKGKNLSYRKENLLAEAQALISGGVKELILISQDTTMYGKDRYGEQSLPELLKDLSSLEGLEWIRVMYVHPAHLSEKLIKSMAETKKMTKYIDLPIQHCNNEILERMNRGITKEEILRKIDKLRKKIPDISIRTTIMVGFPGETEKEFKELLEFVKEVKFDRLGVFSYSLENGTKAAKMNGQVSEEEKNLRKETIYKIQKEISYKKNKEKIGKVLNVLIEEKVGNKFSGRSEFDAPEVDQKVIVRGNAQVGEIVPVSVKKASYYSLEGKVL